MSNTESFIEEVTEEVRKDQLYGYLKKYGWIPALVIVAIVGATGYNEFVKSRQIAEAKSRGDAITAALNLDDPAAQADALAALDGDAGAARELISLQRASSLLAAGDRDGAVALLSEISASVESAQIYRDLADLKRVILLGSDMPSAERDPILSRLAQPGAAFRPIAEEQIALGEIANGDTEGAIERLRALLADSQTTTGQRSRLTQLIVALGATLEESDFQAAQE